ncbi:MAG TPA: NAD-dependent epimerase/dehydratase family protein [Ignavibacteria bacterium]
MNRILIIGTQSFIGANFLELSRNQNIQEVSLKEKLPEEIDFVSIDIVLHLAAIVHQSKKTSELEYFRVNRDLCISVAEEAKKAGVRQFIFLSTVKVYGKYLPGSDPWDEQSECHPDDAYGRSKYEAELELRKLESPEFKVAIIRTPIVYGPGVSANILKLIKLVKKFPILPFRDVNNNRHYTYVGNLIGFIDKIIEIRASGTFIVMDDSQISTTYLVQTIAHFLHRKLFLFRVPKLIIMAGIKLRPAIFDRLYGSFYLDNSKTKKDLKYNPPFTSEEGLSMMISAYMSSRKKEVS